MAFKAKTSATVDPDALTTPRVRVKAGVMEARFGTAVEGSAESTQPKLAIAIVGGEQFIYGKDWCYRLKDFYGVTPSKIGHSAHIHTAQGSWPISDGMCEAIADAISSYGRK